MVEQTEVCEMETMERFGGHLQDVHSLCVDGDLVATGSRDTAARIFDCHSGECISTFGKPVKGGELTVVKGRQGPPILGNEAPEGGHSADVNAVSLDASRGVLYTAGDCLGTTDYLKAWDMKKGTLRADLAGHSEGVYALAKAEELSLLFSGSVDRTIRVWDMNTNQCVHVLEGHTDKVRCLLWDSENKLLYSGSHDNKVLAWSAEDWTIQSALEGHKDWVTSVSLFGEYLVSTSVDKTCKVWDRASGKMVKTLSHENWVTSACFFNELLVTGVGDATIVAWKVATWEKQWSVKAHKEYNAVSALACWGDDVLLTASWDGAVKAWSLEELEQAAEANPESTKKTLEICDGESNNILDGDIFGEEDVDEEADAPRIEELDE